MLLDAKEKASNLKTLHYGLVTQAQRQPRYTMSALGLKSTDSLVPTRAVYVLTFVYFTTHWAVIERLE